MVCILFADGFEETEAVTAADVLKRAGADVRLVGIGGMHISGAHGIGISMDTQISELSRDNIEMVVLPGGMPGTAVLTSDAEVSELLSYSYENNIYIGAICAAPSVLGLKGMLNGRKAVCYPGFEHSLEGAELIDAPVVSDGRIITAKGPGASLPFALELVRVLKGEPVKHKLEGDMQICI